MFEEVLIKGFPCLKKYSLRCFSCLKKYCEEVLNKGFPESKGLT